MLKLLTIFFVASIGLISAQTIDDACLRCICNVESNCNVNIGCRFDVYSDSCGPYQIKEAYWIDCGSPGGSWRTCANDKACADTCVRNYMRRYGTYCTGGRTPTCQDYARYLR